jgi:SpoVK/Ycf46/Vps4 family AAA+-type ATPase
VFGYRSARATTAMGRAGVRERVLSQLLVELDGLQPRAQVLVVAATNRPDLLDSALLRPGRFDRLIHVPLPDIAGRAAILKVLLRKRRCAADINTCDLADRTEQFTGADLKGLCDEASYAALEEDLAAPVVAARHFESALRRCKPSPPPSKQLLQVYLAMQRGSLMTGAADAAT